MFQVSIGWLLWHSIIRAASAGKRLLRLWYCTSMEEFRGCASKLTIGTSTTLQGRGCVVEVQGPMFNSTLLLFNDYCGK